MVPKQSLVVVLTAWIGACGGGEVRGPSPASPAPVTSSVAVSPVIADAGIAIAPAPAPSMFDLQLRSLRRYVDAFNKHDAKAVAALYAEDAVFVERGEFATAGSSAIEDNFKGYFDAFPDATTSITRSWHHGDLVLFEYVEGGTQTGPHRAHTPTGKRVGYVGASLLRFSPEGLVKQDTTYSDELTKEVQAGWAPGPLAAMKVRPTATVPRASDTWEVHQTSGAGDAKAKSDRVQKSLYGSFSLRSEKDFLASLSANVELYAYDEPRDVKGKGEAATLFKEWSKAFTDVTIDAEEVWAVDGYVVVRGTFSGKHIGTWGPVKPTNKTFSSHFLDIVQVDKDDKLARGWSYANNYELLKHLGYQKTEVKAR